MTGLFRDDALAGKVAVVTGAARGMGRAAAIALARAGADIAGIDIAAAVSPRMDFPPATPDELDAVGRAVVSAGRRWRGIVLDQRDGARVRAAAAAIADEFGGVDILFANAGIQTFVPILDMADADWAETIDVNLTGTMNVVRAFAPLLVARGGGRIIVTSSTQGQHGMLDGSAYSASKWGLIGLVKSAALELGPHGITVNALVPGLIDTPLTRHEDRYAQAIRVGGHDPSGDEAKDREMALAALAAKLPARVPWVEAEDIAPAVVFLASDAARMISGTSLAVTGGDSANVTA